MLKVKLVKTKEEAKNIQSFFFSPSHKLHYIAGQFIELYLPHINADQRGQKHWFTLSSSPTEDLLSITTKFAGDNSSSFKKRLFNMKPGEEIEMSSPMGDFVLPKSSNIPLIFVAGGIGITPFRSIIKYTQDSNHENRDITLIYNTSTRGELAFPETLAGLGNNFIEIVGERLTAERIISLSKPSTNHYLYLSGPEPMVEQLNDDLKDVLGRTTNIYTDFFPGYTY